MAAAKDPARAVVVDWVAAAKTVAESARVEKVASLEGCVTVTAREAVDRAVV